MSDSAVHDGRGWSRLEIAAWLAALAVLVGLSGWLAITRIYQVDEFQNMFVARLLATGQGRDSFTAITLYLAPLAWFSQGVSESVQLFRSARLLAWALFWLNLVLLAIASGERLRSRRGLMVLAGGATLAPLWDYGFEVRHDNLLLTGLLLLLISLRVFPRGTPSYAVAGALSLGLEFIAFKSFVYTIPISLLAIAFPPPASSTNRVRFASAWTAGAVGAFLLVRLGYGVAGWWDLYVRDVSTIFEVAVEGARFGPWFALARLAGEAPLLAGFTVSGLVVVLSEMRHRHPGGMLQWEGHASDGCLVLISLAALLINPFPYPYNLVNVVPFMYLFSWRLASTLVERPRRPGGLVPLAIVVILAHLVPFISSTRRHFQMTNVRQEELIDVAERLTEPRLDPVYDGIGMVPTRSSIHAQWFLHGTNIESFVTGSRLSVRDMLAAKPAAVIIPSYRTDWLSSEDHDFIRGRYVPLADDFWVLGSILPLTGGPVDIVHPGRYGLTIVQGATVPLQSSAAFDGTVDGSPVGTAVVELQAGRHRIECAAGCRPAVVWLGPRLNQIPELGPGDHRLLFASFY